MARHVKCARCACACACRAYSARIGHMRTSNKGQVAGAARSPPPQNRRNQDTLVKHSACACLSRRPPQPPKAYLQLLCGWLRRVCSPPAFAGQRKSISAVVYTRCMRHTLVTLTFNVLWFRFSYLPLILGQSVSDINVTPSTVDCTVGFLQLYQRWSSRV